MQERESIITIIIVVAVYNLVDQLLVQKRRGINDVSIVISFVIAEVLYFAVIFLW